MKILKLFIIFMLLTACGQNQSKGILFKTELAKYRVGTEEIYVVVTNNSNETMLINAYGREIIEKKVDNKWISLPFVLDENEPLEDMYFIVKSEDKMTIIVLLEKYRDDFSPGKFRIKFEGVKQSDNSEVISYAEFSITE